MDRVIRATSVAIVVFATIVAFIVGSRIDQNTISLLSGTLIGILVTAPCVAIITFVAVRRRESNSVSSYDRSMRQSVPMPQSPPQYWVLPQQFQGMGNPAGNPAYAHNAIAAGIAAPNWPMAQEDMQYLPRPRRRFYVIGENGEPKLLEDGSAGNANDPYAIDSDEPGAAF
jgi:hypothetical protein